MTDVRLRMVLEVPAERTKQARGWPEGICRILVFDDSARDPCDRDRRAELFADWIPRLLKAKSEDIYAHPVECFYGDKKMQRFLDSGPLRRAAVRVAEWYWLIPCGDYESLVYLMTRALSNQVVFFAAPSQAVAHSVVLEGGARAQLEKGDGFEGPLLRLAHMVGAFVFWSYTHDNLEVLGERPFLLENCVPKLLGQTIGGDPRWASLGAST